MSAAATATASPKRSKLLRILMFALAGVPGAVLISLSGVGVAAAVADGEWPGMAANVLAIILAAFLISIGTGISERPLYLLAVLPLPILTSTGYYLARSSSPWGFPLGLVGALAPAAIYPIHRYYQKRAEMQKQLAASQPTTH
jgi:hypothetical protein